MSNLLENIDFGEADEDDGSPVIISGNPNVIDSCPLGAVVAWVQRGDIVLYTPQNIKETRKAFEIAVEGVLSYHDACSKMGLPFNIHYPMQIDNDASQKAFDGVVSEAFMRASGRSVSSSFIEVYKVIGGIINAMEAMGQTRVMRHESMIHYGAAMLMMREMFDETVIMWPMSVGSTPGGLMTEMEDIILSIFNNNATRPIEEGERKIRMNWRPSIQAMMAKFRNESVKLGISKEPKPNCMCKECRLERGILSMEVLDKKIEAIAEYLIDTSCDMDDVDPLIRIEDV